MVVEHGPQPVRAGARARHDEERDRALDRLWLVRDRLRQEAAVTPFAGDHGAAVEVALLVGRHRGGGEKEDAHPCLAVERPLDQGVHDEDDGDDGEEDAVDVDF